jgi:hypothetical protein
MNINHKAKLHIILFQTKNISLVIVTNFALQKKNVELCIFHNLEFFVCDLSQDPYQVNDTLLDNETFAKFKKDKVKGFAGELEN